MGLAPIFDRLGRLEVKEEGFKYPVNRTADLRNVAMRTALLIAILVIPVAAQADTVYVDDMLRVNVRKELDRGSEVVGIIVTGTALEVLQRQGGYLKIRAPKGLTGWIKDKYISVRKPARLRIGGVVSASEDMKSRIVGLEKKLGDTRQDNHDLQEQVSVLKQQTNGFKQRHKSERGANKKIPGSAQQPRFQFFGGALLFWIGGILFATLLGFILGIGWYKGRVSRKLGGFNI